MVRLTLTLTLTLIVVATVVRLTLVLHVAGRAAGHPGHHRAACGRRETPAADVDRPMVAGKRECHAHTDYIPSPNHNPAISLSLSLPLTLTLIQCTHAHIEATPDNGIYEYI